MEHTKEPYRLVGNGEIVGSDNNTVAIIIADAKAEANARRMVACINAMAGIDDDNVLFRRGSVGTVRKHIVTQQVQIEKLTAERDELLAVLERIIDACDACVADDGKSLVDEFTEEMEASARAVIQKVRGGE